MRTPLSDIKAASSIKKQPLHNLPKSATLKNRGKNTILSEMNAFEDFIKGDFEDLSGKLAVDDCGYEPIGLYNIKSKVQSTPIISLYAVAHSSFSTHGS
jgi:hypothetical protein